MLSKMVKKNEGFTLIELMIVIAIIGILAAIAIPQFAAYRARSFNSAAQADLRNAATAQEAYFVDNETYCGTVATLVGNTYGLFTSSGVVFAAITATGDGYIMRSWHPRGTTSYVIDGPGGSIESYP
jgi:type IV pilus assembly protein PilA